MSLLWCRVTTAAISSSTVTLRKNSANANNTISINANTTGAFSDTTPHNDTIATGDLIAVEVVAALVLVVWMKSLRHLVVQPLGSCQVLVLIRTSFITSETSGVKLRTLAPKSLEEPCIIPIDHAFNVKGIGTVILGVIKQGTVKTYDQLMILPSGNNILVKSIQMHDDPVNESKSPARVGLAIKGVREKSM
jgi:hypothetical protein